MSDFGQGGGWADMLGLEEEPQAPFSPAPQYAEAAPYDESAYQAEEQAVEPPQDFVDQEMTEAEQRLLKAQLYRQFLVGSVFEGGSDPLTAEVEREFKVFARQQLQRLLGVAQQPRPDELTRDEVKVLKLLAGAALRDAKVRRAASTPERPAPTPQVRAPEPKRATPRPQLRPRPVPEGVRPQQSRPVQPPQRPQPQQARPQQARPPGPRPQQPPRPAAPASRPLLPDGKQYEENNRRYKVSWRQMTRPDEYGPRAAQILEGLDYGRDVVLPNGIHVLKTDGGELYKIIHQDLTPQVRGEGGVPFPTDNHHLEAIVAASSNIALQRVDPSLRGLGDHLAKT